VHYVHTQREENEKRGKELEKMYATFAIEENYFLERVVHSDTFLADAQGDASWEIHDAEKMLKYFFNKVSHFTHM
jgi:hypothetical protein